MDAGALGAEIVLSGKVTGARSRVEKFNRGYIKHNGEPAEDVVDEGQGVSVMKLGTIGVTVKIIPPGAELPDDFTIAEDAEIEAVEQVAADEGVEALLEEPDEAVEADDDDADEPVPDFADEAVETPTADPAEVVDEEVVEEVVEETGEAPVATGEPDDADEAAPDPESLDEEVEAEAADLVAEMEEEDEEADDE